MGETVGAASSDVTVDEVGVGGVIVDELIVRVDGNGVGPRVGTLEYVGNDVRVIGTRGAC